MNMHCLFYELESKVFNVIALISDLNEASCVETCYICDSSSEPQRKWNL